jgi:hypothetical protein
MLRDKNTISAYLRYPRPHINGLQDFFEFVTQELVALGLQPRCLGVTDSDPDAPMVTIRNNARIKWHPARALYPDIRSSM